MKNKRLIALFLLGQLADLLTTIYARERFPEKMYELNPLLRRYVRQKKWSKLLLIKLLSSVFTLAFISIFVNTDRYASKKRAEDERCNMLKIVAAVIWIFALSNLAQIVLGLLRPAKEA